jgi:hypothetical protein
VSKLPYCVFAIDKSYRVKSTNAFCVFLFLYTKYAITFIFFLDKNPETPGNQPGSESIIYIGIMVNVSRQVMVKQFI